MVIKHTLTFLNFRIESPEMLQALHERNEARRLIDDRVLIQQALEGSNRCFIPRSKAARDFFILEMYHDVDDGCVEGEWLRKFKNDHWFSAELENYGLK